MLCYVMLCYVILCFVMLTWHLTVVTMTEKSTKCQLLNVTFYCYAPARRKGGNKRCFCPSVRLSVAYVANNSKTQKPSVGGWKVPHLWCDCRTSFKVKRSKYKVTMHINAHKHRVPYLPNGKAYKLQTWYTDAGWIPASTTRAMTFKIKGQGHTRPINDVTHRPPYLPNDKANELQLSVRMEDDEPQVPWPPRSKVKVARSRDQSELSWPNAVPVSLEAGGGIQFRQNPAATHLVTEVLRVALSTKFVEPH